MNGETKLKAFLIISIFLLGMACTAAVGETIYVDMDAPGENDGSSWTDAFNYLQDALADANSGDEIHVAEGIYTPDSNSAEPSGSGDRTATFQLVEDVTIKGGYAGFGEPNPNARDIEEYETILSGDLDGNDVEVNDPCDLLYEPTRAENSYHVVSSSIPNMTDALDGFTVTAGNANGPWQERYNRGGGMYNDSGSPTIANCMFSANSSGEGGGMYNSEGSPTVTNCTFKGNSSEGGGGGMYNDHSSLTLTNCTFKGNSAVGWWGNGGGVYNYGDSSPTLTNCIFSGNTASSVGAGMHNLWCNPTLTNCTFSGNWAVYGATVFNDESRLTLNNCILWDEGDEIGIYDGLMITVTYSDVQGGWSGKGNIDADPCFVDPENSDYHLLPDSPCIDAGDPNYVAEPNETDLDGKPRVINGRIDMGAYEYSTPITAYVDIEPDTLNLTSKGKWITSYIGLPEDYNVTDIDPNSVLLENEIKPDSFRLIEDQQMAIAKFSREEVQAILDIGDIELTITGRLTDGTVFEGRDIIRVIDRGGGKMARQRQGGYTDRP